MDFSKLKYRVDTIPVNKSVITQYPDLGRYAHKFADQGDMPNELTPDFVMRYIILMYCPGSPGVEEIPELNKRKAWALRFLNVEPDNNKRVEDHINGLLGFRYRSVIDKVVLFLRVVKNHEWSLMLAAEQKQTDLLAQMFIPKTDVQEERTLQQAIEMNMRLLSDVKKRFLDGEKSRDLDDGVNQFLADENLNIDPESYMVEFGNTGTVFKGVVP